MQHDDNAGDDAPSELVDALTGLRQAPVVVPPQLDEAILTQVRQRLAGRRKHGRNIIQLRPWLAAAALLIATAMIVPLVLYFREPTVVLRADIDHNGRVDILDAFALARRLQAGQLDPTAFDLNGDGLVDRRDVDHISAQAVKLDKGHI